MASDQIESNIHMAVEDHIQDRCQIAETPKIGGHMAGIASISFLSAENAWLRCGEATSKRCCRLEVGALGRFCSPLSGLTAVRADRSEAKGEGGVRGVDCRARRLCGKRLAWWRVSQHIALDA